MHAAWRAFWHSREILDAHASKWANQLAEVGDLAGKLALFCQDRIK
jgi:hypothetical protein